MPTDSLPPQLPDSMLPVLLAQPLETLSLVSTLLMLLLVDQDSTPSTELVLLVQPMPTLVTEELSPHVIPDSS